jgi:hypothetical protein
MSGALAGVLRTCRSCYRHSRSWPNPVIILAPAESVKPEIFLASWSHSDWMIDHFAASTCRLAYSLPTSLFGREISDLGSWKIARCRRMIQGGFCGPRSVEDLGNMDVILGRAQAIVEDSGHNRIVGAEHDPDA